MRYSHLFKLISNSDLSPEQFADRLGISGMTIRRWRELNPNQEIPKKYETAVIDAMHQLITEGKLSHEAAGVQSVLKENSNLSIGTALKSLGLSVEDLQGGDKDSEPLLDLLTRIGMDRRRQEQVRDSKRMLTTFQNIGNTWKENITLLRRALSSNKIGKLDKLVAYGALFYLITPFDLIPDYIPVVGLLDDYAILAIAVAYYLRHFRHMLKDVNNVTSLRTPEPA